MSDFYAPAAPKDNCKGIWFCCLLLGIGGLLPWNAFITAVGYFSSLNPSFPFAFWVGLAFNYPNIAMLFINVAIGDRISVRTKVIFGLLVQLLAIIAIPAAGRLLESHTAVWVCLALAGVSGFATAVFGGASMGLVAMLPGEYTTAVMSGQGVAGIIAGGVQIILLIAMPVPSDPTEAQEVQFRSALIYFTIAGFVLIGAFIAFITMIKSSFVKWHLLNAAKGEKQPLMGVNGSDDFDAQPTVSKATVLKKIGIDAFNVVFVFFVSLSLFPGMTYSIKSLNYLPDRQDLYSVILVALFQVFDFVGRTLPQFVMLIPKKFLIFPNILRAAFFPLFILCISPRLFNNDIWPIVFMIVMSFTNGFFSTLAMIYGPTRVEPHERETAGFMMITFLQSGIFLGLHFAILLNYLVLGVNPFA
jgi:equilibrative nucleoside transporter 1/2/3